MVIILFEKCNQILYSGASQSSRPQLARTSILSQPKAEKTLGKRPDLNNAKLAGTGRSMPRCFRQVYSPLEADAQSLISASTGHPPAVYSSCTACLKRAFTYGAHTA